MGKEPGQIQLALKGTSFRDCVATGRDLVLEENSEIPNKPAAQRLKRSQPGS